MGRLAPLVHGNPVNLRLRGLGAGYLRPAPLNRIPYRHHVHRSIILPPRLPTRPQRQLLRWRVIVEDDQQIDIAIRPGIPAAPVGQTAPHGVGGNIPQPASVTLPAPMDLRAFEPILFDRR